MSQIETVIVIASGSVTISTTIATVLWRIYKQIKKNKIEKAQKIAEQARAAAELAELKILIDDIQSRVRSSRERRLPRWSGFRVRRARPDR